MQFIMLATSSGYLQLLQLQELALGFLLSLASLLSYPFSRWHSPSPASASGKGWRRAVLQWCLSLQTAECGDAPAPSDPPELMK